MDVKAHGLVVVDHPSVPRSLVGSVLALPIELLIGKELVSVPVVKVHVVLIHSHEEKDVRRLNDEPDVPNGLAERESERRWDGLTLITLP